MYTCRDCDSKWTYKELDGTKCPKCGSVYLITPPIEKLKKPLSLSKLIWLSILFLVIVYFAFGCIEIDDRLGSRACWIGLKAFAMFF